MEYRLKHKNGTFHWLLDSGSPFFDSENTFLRYIGSCYDINDRKLNEELQQNHTIEIEKINKLMVDRELKMIELKKEIESLKKQIAK